MKQPGRLALFIAVSLLVTACGRKGPLLYPDMLVPAAPADVAAMQSGSAIKFQFVLPSKDLAGRPVQGIAGVKITKKSAEISPKEFCRLCMADYRPFHTLYLDSLPVVAELFGSRMVVIDADASAGNTYSYNIVPFTKDGTDGVSTLTMTVGVTEPFPAPTLQIESLPTEVKLHITLPSLVAGRLLGYNLYRSTGTSVRYFNPLNPEPLKGHEYIDSSLERGKKYRYSARVLIMRTSGEIAESAGSEEVTGMLKDDE
jgi:predicted small lipoprotein YifL